MTHQNGEARQFRRSRGESSPRPASDTFEWDAVRHEWLDEGLPVVSRLAMRYSGNGLGIDDLMAAGRLGLVEAAMRFDPERGTTFTTYATWWVRKRMIDALFAQSRSIAASRYRIEQQQRLADVRRRLRMNGDDSPDVIDLAERSQLSVRVTRRALSEPVRVVSLDSSEDPDGEAPVDRLEQRSEHDPLSVTMRRQDMRRVEELLRELPERDRAILKWRYGLSGEEPMSSQRVGDRVGLSRERIRQIEQRCLGWLRRRLGLRREG